MKIKDGKMKNSNPYEHTVCSECGAILKDGKLCHDYFNQMLVWDFEDYAGAGSLHHLTVLCYHLQHPRLYSSEALEYAEQMLRDIIEEGMTAQDLLEKNSSVLKSKKRTWKFEGTPEDCGSYPSKIKWSMTVVDVTSQGLSQYPKLVHKWAKSIHEDLNKI